MPKSQIIKDIVEDNVSLEKSLNRLYVIAKDINNKTLSKWIENELNGYKGTDDIPEYRHIKSNNFRYSGINGNFQVKNTPLPSNWIKSELLDTISNLNICENIHYVEDMANSEGELYRDLSLLAGEVYKSTNGNVSCTSIQQIVSPSDYQSVYSQVKNKTILALIELEKKYGNLDSLGIDISDKKSIQVDALNDDLNRTVFNINVPQVESKKIPWYSKFARIIIPAITTIIGAIVSAVVIKKMGL